MTKDEIIEALIAELERLLDLTGEEDFQSITDLLAEVEDARKAGAQ